MSETMRASHLEWDARSAFWPAQFVKPALGVWIAMIVFNGVSFRERETITAESAADWLIIVQLACALAGGALGLFLLRRTPLRQHGIGAWVMILYAALALFSTFFTPFPRLVMGYAALLTGAVALTLGLTAAAASPQTLSRIETIWLVVTTACVFLEGGQGVIRPAVETQGVFRLQMGSSIHPNLLSLMAAMVFWLSFKDENRRHKAPLWVLRLVLLAIILGTRSRVSLVCFLSGGAARYWMVLGFGRAKSLFVRFGMPCLCVSVLLVGALFLSFRNPAAVSALDTFNRNEPASSTMSLSWRTEIWPAVWRQASSDSVGLLFGRGFGVAGLVMKDHWGKLDFEPANAHNSFLEFLLTLGVGGAILYLIMVLYGLHWFGVFRGASCEATRKLALNGFCATVMIALTSITETIYSGKPNPVMLAMIFYLVILDPIRKMERERRNLTR